MSEVNGYRIYIQVNVSTYGEMAKDQKDRLRDEVLARIQGFMLDVEMDYEVESEVLAATIRRIGGMAA